MGDREVHVWCCRADAFGSSDDFRRRVLSHYAAVVPSEWVFGVGAHGKPHLSGPSIAQALDFNLSHSGDWLVCAVTGGIAVGVDLEVYNARRDSMKLARRFFNRREVEALQAYPTASRDAQFYDLWTLKEASIKARGEALPPQLEHHAFALSACTSIGVPAVIMPLFSDELDPACYFLLETWPGYALALCLLSPPLQQLHFRQLELAEDGDVRECALTVQAAS